MNIPTDAEFNQIEAGLQSERHGALSELDALDQKAGDYRVKLTEQEAAHLAGEREVARDALRDVELKLATLAEDRAAAVVARVRQAELEKERQLKHALDRLNNDARALQDGIAKLAPLVAAMNMDRELILAVLDYVSPNPAVLSPNGWYVPTRVHEFDTTMMAYKLADREMGRLFSGKGTELVEIVAEHGRAVETEWLQFQQYKRQAAAKAAAPAPAPRPAAAPTAGAASALHVGA